MNKVFGIVWRSLLVGLVYAGSLSLIGNLLHLIGLSLPGGGGSQFGLLWIFIGGTLAGLFLGPIAAALPASRASHMLIWSSVLVFNLASLAIEGHFYNPDLIGQSFAGLLFQQLLISVITGAAITFLFAPQGTSVPSRSSSRGWFSWIWRFVVSAFSYLFLYFVFGATNYALVTKPYYESHAGGLTTPAPQVVLMAELVRAPLIVLSVLPFLLAARGTRKRLAILTGLILFSVGGLLPLTSQVQALPLFLLAASAVEIFFQNFGTGLVAGLLLGSPE